jgi:hypothetical protein
LSESFEVPTLDTLEQVLKPGGISRVEEYEWKGRSYLHVFIVRAQGCAWDGPRTDKALSMIDEAKEARRRQGR